ncbi:RDD family protein [Paraburkholderia rhizosphaerae]|uniref:Putative RDD family membrane protein YckC n=1 Tax=Paraburkholderia rhizosphaerae TaxID=480658 RepID=A0A4R8LJU2_9BURK|nr:RDD family protein [Paraburkholderia rhizosphaerae]TDY44372.1 putative RDD family membrane protein YckC [Paraburkholderia rhizosphaerae]
MPYANFSQRARALFIDSIWWTVILLFIPLGPSTGDLLSRPDSLGLTVAFWLLVGQCVPILITGVMWALWGTSPGKRAVRIQIVDADSGKPITPRQALLRTFGYLLTFAMCGAGFLWIPFNRRAQALHDRIANTVVVNAATVTDVPAKTVRTTPVARSEL